MSESAPPMAGRVQPRREEMLGLPQLHLSTHPVLLHKLTLLRRRETPHNQFRSLVRELTWLIGYEAMADLTLSPRRVRTPLEEADGWELREHLALVPILRAGLGMVEGMLDLMPRVQVWHLGLYRDERTLQPVPYYSRLASAPRDLVCFLLDPMLATGGSAVGAVDLLKQHGMKRIKFVGLIAAPYGVQALARAHPDVDIHVAALDDRLDEQGFIRPGLGDAGDRQFGTEAPRPPPDGSALPAVEGEPPPPSL